MRKSNPEEWTLELGTDGCWYIVDEYGEEIDFCGGDYASAKRGLKLFVAEEMKAREVEGPGPDQDPMRNVEFPFAENH